METIHQRETGDLHKVASLKSDVVTVIYDDGPICPEFVRPGIRARQVAVWRLVARLLEGYTGPIVKDLDPKWEDNDTILRCQRCGLDCT